MDKPLELPGLTLTGFRARVCSDALTPLELAFWSDGAAWTDCRARRANAPTEKIMLIVLMPESSSSSADSFVEMPHAEEIV